MFSVEFLRAGKHRFQLAFEVFDLIEKVESILRLRSTSRGDSLFGVLLTEFINTVDLNKSLKLGLAKPYHRTLTKLLSSCVLWKLKNIHEC